MVVFFSPVLLLTWCCMMRLPSLAWTVVRASQREIYRANLASWPPPNACGRQIRRIGIYGGGQNAKMAL